MPLDQMTDKRVGQLVRLRVSNPSLSEDGIEPGATGTVVPGFAGLLCVLFDGGDLDDAYVSVSVDGLMVWVVNLCDPIESKGR